MKKILGATLVLAAVGGASWYYQSQGGWLAVAVFWLVAISAVSAIATGVGLIVDWFEDLDETETEKRWN